MANSYTIDYKDEEPTLTWYMDTSVCETGSGEMYLDGRSGIAYSYSCTFDEGVGFGGGSYVYDEYSDPLLYAGAIKREEGITVKYNASNPKEIDY